MIVDDEPSLRLLLAQYLKGHYEVIAAASGEEALELLKTNTPHGLVIDLNMEGMSGLEVIKKLRASEKWRLLPIIVLSSNDTSHDRIEALRTGADDYLVKPFNPEELEVRLEVIRRRAPVKL